MKNAVQAQPLPEPVWDLVESNEVFTRWRIRAPLVAEVAPTVEASARGVQIKGAVWDVMGVYEIAQLRAVLNSAALAARLYQDKEQRR